MAASHQRGGGGGHAPATLTMAPLPVLLEGGVLSRTVGASHDWGQAQSNLEDARATAEVLRNLVADAVYLDEEAYQSASHMSVYQQRAQAAERRIIELENEAAALRAEVENKSAALVGAAARQRETQAQVAELQQELENNAVVFNMHYGELLARNEEIERLKNVIEGLQGGGGPGQ